MVVVQPKAHANCGEPVARPQTGVGTDGDGDGDGVTERRPVAERIGVRGGTGIDLWRPFSTASWRAIWPTVSSRRRTLADKLEAGLVPLVPADPCCGSPTARGLDSQETLR